MAGLARLPMTVSLGWHWHSLVVAAAGWNWPGLPAS